MRPSLSSLWISVFILLASMLGLPALGQEPVPQTALARPRIVEALDETQRTTLRGNTHPLAVAKFDRGAAPATLPLERMLLVLKRSPEQDAALVALLDQQQDKSSPQYHKWLTPGEFGKQFGPADADIQMVTSWLQSHGLQINQVSKGRTVIEFSGTAAMVQDAFHTQIHRYAVQSESHWANASDPQIPDALTPVVAGVWSMHNFLKKPMLRISAERFPLTYPPGATHPLATNSSGVHFLSPGDFALIYGINPVYQAGINGNGVNISVIGRSNFNISDVSTFHGIFSLPFVGVNTILNGPDPGDLGRDEEAEAVLDVTWSGAVAPNAQVAFILSASTNTTDGVDLSELYAIDNNQGDILTESFSSCEAHASSAEVAAVSSLAEQAAAQGMTYFVSSGDTGSAGCDNLSETTATGPVSVNVLASTPFNVAVGGTIFNEGIRPSSYWSANTNTFITALKYIPENVWNESCASSRCGKNANIAAGVGGPSSVVSKPTWQSGQNLHIPADGFRDVPDVSLSAALHDPYLLCLAGSCGQNFLVGIAGTSASAPSFAGIMALVEQKVGGRVGLANYVLYHLANAETLSQCNASSTSGSPASTCVFNDVTVGNNAVPGESSYGGASPQFTAAVGYDLATGLGSVQVNNLVNSWASVTFATSSTTLTLTPTPTTVLHGTAVQANVTVSPSSGSAKPTGLVSLIATPTGLSSNGVATFSLSNGSASGVTHVLPGGQNYAVRAHYPGDLTFAPSDSPMMLVTVNPEPSTTSVSVLTIDSKGSPVPFTSGPYGSFVYLRADVAGQSGFGYPSGSIQFADSATPLGGVYVLNSQGNTATPNGYPFLAAGAHSIGASYNGDASFQPSASTTPVSVTITKASTTASLTSAATAVPSGSTVMLTATVDTSSRGNAPSGNVVFSNGGTPLPGNAPLASSTNTTTGFAQGIATYQASLPNGQDSVTAQYADDANYTGSTSSAVNITVAPDFSLAFTGTTGNVMTISAPGASGTLTLAVSGQNYTGTVNFSRTACKGLPLGASCSFNPPTVTGTGSATLTVMTVASHVALRRATHARTFWFANGGLCLAGVFLLGAAPRRRRISCAASLILSALLLTLTACGGSGSGGGGGTTIGTPPGTYIVAVTGADANFSHPVTFTLNIL